MFFNCIYAERSWISPQNMFIQNYRALYFNWFEISFFPSNEVQAHCHGHLNNNNEKCNRLDEIRVNCLLTFVDNWLDRLCTWSRASPNSRFKRRTSWACRSSDEPYIDEPPDTNDAALPCTIFNHTKKKCFFPLFINVVHIRVARMKPFSFINANLIIFVKSKRNKDSLPSSFLFGYVRR